MRLAYNGHKMMFAIRIHRDIFFQYDFPVGILIVKKRYRRFIQRVKTAERLVHIHLRYPQRGMLKAVVCKVQSQCQHDFPEMMLN